MELNRANVPLVDLSMLKDRRYLQDALIISSRIPQRFSPRRSCSIERPTIDLKRIEKKFFGHRSKLKMICLRPRVSRKLSPIFIDSSGPSKCLSHLRWAQSYLIPLKARQSESSLMEKWKLTLNIKSHERFGRALLVLQTRCWRKTNQRMTQLFQIISN